MHSHSKPLMPQFWVFLVSSFFPFCCLLILTKDRQALLAFLFRQINIVWLNRLIVWVCIFVCDTHKITLKRLIVSRTRRQKNYMKNSSAKRGRHTKHFYPKYLFLWFHQNTFKCCKCVWIFKNSPLIIIIGFRNIQWFMNWIVNNVCCLVRVCRLGDRRYWRHVALLRVWHIVMPYFESTNADFCLASSIYYSRWKETKRVTDKMSI